MTSSKQSQDETGTDMTRRPQAFRVTAPDGYTKTPKTNNTEVPVITICQVGTSSYSLKCYLLPPRPTPPKPIPPDLPKLIFTETVHIYRGRNACDK